jgi:enamine deaminase RidA (YjgF/YER057c/UK114 family)
MSVGTTPHITQASSTRHIVNPWAWQDGFGYAQAVDVAGNGRTVFCAGQASIDDDGRPVHPGDMRRQVEQAFDNLETVLAAARAGLGDVVRLCFFTTDVQRLFAVWDAVTDRLGRAGCRPASSLLGVQALAFPDLLVEIAATAVVGS